MRKTNKNLTKQILTLMLAFIMVFTGMSIGSWGVDTAWADTQITVNGAVLEEITGSKYSGDVDVFLAKVDENATTISLSVDSSYYIRVESTFYLEPTYATESIYSQTAWYNSAEAYVAYQECGSANVEDLLAESGCDSIEAYLEDYYGYSNVEEYMEQEVGETVQNAWAEEGYKTIPYNNGSYTVTLPGVEASINASTFSQYFGNSSKSYDATAKRYYLFELCQDINGIFGRTADCKAVVLVQVGGGLTIDCDRLNAAIAQAVGIKAADYHAQNDGYNGKKSINDLRKELAANETIKKDTAILNKISSKEAPITSFWSLYEAAMARVDDIYPADTDGVRSLKDGISQSQVEAAAELLKVSIANLIPTSQLNATKLYEALRPLYWVGSTDQLAYEGIASQQVSADNCTQASWTAYTQAKEPAAAYLAKLFREDGSANEKFNKHENQEEADKLADAVDPAQLVNQEKYDTAYQNWKKREAEANSLLVQYDPAKLRKADYTEASWKTYTDTYHALKEIAEYRIVGGTKPDYEMLKGFYRNGYLTDLLVQSYNGLVSQGDITITLQYTNGLAAAYPAVRTSGTDAYRGEVSLKDGNTTVKDAFDKAGIILDTGKKMTGIVPSVAWGTTDSAETPYFAVYVDDEFRGVYQRTNQLSGIYLKDGAKVRLNRIVQPLFESEDSTSMTSSAIFRLPADASMYRDSAAVIRIDSMTSDLKVGDKAKLQLSLKDAYGTDRGTQRSAEGITLFVSETPGKTKEAAGQPTRKTTAVTKADGSMEYVFAEEGWYWVAAHNVTPDKYYFQNIYRETTDGIYYSLQCGDAMLVCVSANENESALITSQRNENLAVAKAFYESFHDYDFPAGYYIGDFKIAYENLKTNQNEATTFKALMDSFETDYAALQNCAAQKLDHDARIASLREDLIYVPEDLSTLNDGDKDFIKSVQNAYADLNDYEKNLLTPKELEKLEATAKVDTAKLPVRATVQVEKAYNDSTLPKKNDDGAANYNWPNRAWHLPPNLDGSEPEPKWGFGDGTVSDLPFSAKAGEYVVVRKYLNTTDEQYWMVWTIDNWQTTHLAEAQTLPSRDTNGLIIMWHDGYFLAKYQIPKDIADGSTITFDLKMVDKATYERLAGITETPEQLAAAKTAALESLKAAYQAYDEANYTPDNWTVLTAAYEKGKTDIEAAATSEAAADARKAAIAAMATIAAKGGSENPSVTDYDSGKTVGKVYVSIENNTYPGGDFTGTIAGGWYDLGENDSMMTCVLKALKQAGYSWQGTSGSSKDKNADYSITYLSSIEKDGKSLGESDGNSKSGWMGTLNDWFVNQGFHAFTVKNGQLENGDEIHVMFTMAYGEDLGGTWNNNSTKLAGLTVSGGTLSPAFSGSQTDYTLIISGDKANVTVKPEAVNKNYQARIFLNRYNQDSARYKRTETISVKSGDVLYVGVGESGWPTMNASSVGTKYTIKVVSGSDSAAVDKMLKELKKITYANYKAEKGNVEAARAAYNALDAEGKREIAAADLKKLTDAEAQIKFYTEIDDVKAKLNALTDSSSRSQTKAALDAYEKLSEEQKQYITVADAAKYKELAEKYSLSGISGAVEMPESEVETTGKTGSATTTSPAEVKMSGITATVTVKADNQKEILKQAKEKKSAQVILAIANSDAKGAEKLELNLEKSFLESLLKDTSAKLVVKTPLGQKTYERDELQKLVNETTGTTVKAEINKDNVDAQTEEPIDDNAAKIAKAKSIVKDMKLVARSGKTAKKNIKAVLKSDAKVNASIKEMKDLGFTVKYRFYRSTKKAASYKSTVTKKTAAYTNTSGKKGTKYFYKVQVRVYDENGKLVAKTALKQCKYASRVWTKAK